MTHQKHIVFRIVVEAVTAINCSPKNATAEKRDKALGAIGMAAELGAIDYHLADAAQAYVRTAANWRGVKNFPNMEQWLKEAVEAESEFNRQWVC